MQRKLENNEEGDNPRGVARGVVQRGLIMHAQVTPEPTDKCMHTNLRVS